MSAYPIQEPSVVRYNHSAAGEVLQALLQGAYCIHIHIIGRLVKQQYISLFFKCQGKVQPVALTSAKDAAELLLVCSGEIESGDISSCINLPVSKSYKIGILRNCLIYGLVWVYGLVLLVYVGNLYCLTNLKLSGVRLVVDHNKAE